MFLAPSTVRSDATTSECRDDERQNVGMRGHSGFAQLRIFAQNGTSPFSQAFCDWQSRYHHISECDWKEASARTFGIVRVPTATDFAREDSAGEPTWEPQCHPFYSCPHDLSAARNIWVLPAAPAWWHQVLWGLQREWDGRESLRLSPCRNPGEPPTRLFK